MLVRLCAIYHCPIMLLNKAREDIARQKSSVTAAHRVQLNKIFTKIYSK